MKKLLKVKEVAEILQMHENTVKRWLRDKKLKGVKFGKGWRIEQADLRKFLNNNKNNLVEKKEQNKFEDAIYIKPGEYYVEYNIVFEELSASDNGTKENETSGGFKVNVKDKEEKRLSALGGQLVNDDEILGKVLKQADIFEASIYASGKKFEYNFNDSKMIKIKNISVEIKQKNF